MILVVHRLSPVGQSNDAEPATTHCQSGSAEVAVLVGSAMKDRGRHPTHDLGIDGYWSCQVDDSRNAAHERISVRQNRRYSIRVSGCCHKSGAQRQNTVIRPASLSPHASLILCAYPELT